MPQTASHQDANTKAVHFRIQPGAIHSEGLDGPPLGFGLLTPEQEAEQMRKIKQAQGFPVYQQIDVRVDELRSASPFYFNDQAPYGASLNDRANKPASPKGNAFFEAYGSPPVLKGTLTEARQRQIANPLKSFQDHVRDIMIEKYKSPFAQRMAAAFVDSIQSFCWDDTGLAITGLESHDRLLRNAQARMEDTGKPETLDDSLLTSGEDAKTVTLLHQQRLQAATRYNQGIVSFLHLLKQVDACDRHMNDPLPDPTDPKGERTKKAPTPCKAILKVQGSLHRLAGLSFAQLLLLRDEGHSFIERMQQAMHTFSWDETMSQGSADLFHLHDPRHPQQPNDWDIGMGGLQGSGFQRVVSSEATYDIGHQLNMHEPAWYELMASLTAQTEEIEQARLALNLKRLLYPAAQGNEEQKELQQLENAMHQRLEKLVKPRSKKAVNGDIHGSDEDDELRFSDLDQDQAGHPTAESTRNGQANVASCHGLGDSDQQRAAKFKAPTTVDEAKALLNKTLLEAMPVLDDSHQSDELTQPVLLTEKASHPVTLNKADLRRATRMLAVIQGYKLPPALDAKHLKKSALTLHRTIEAKPADASTATARSQE